jgi:casein kinase I homolog HRR25
VSFPNPQLKHEYEIYKIISPGAGISKIHWFGFECSYRLMVMDALGPDMAKLLDFCGGKFSLKTVLLIADQLIHRIQHIHTKGVVHRDLKPDNILMGVGRRGNTVYIADFGLADRYMEEKEHIEPGDGVPLVGTVTYASVNNHQGLSW